MSAYVSNPEAFGILAAYAVINKCAVSEWIHYRTGRDADIKNVQIVAKGLARENIRSVAHRYPEDKDGHRPGPCLLDAEIEEAAALYATHFLTNAAYVRKLAPVQILKVCQSVDYQSCETDDWRDTLAWRQLDWIKNNAVYSLAGYDEADWSYERPIPEIEALYERSAA